jgi:RNA polymerase sigma-70 factor (ECF subfamily)
MTHVGFLEAGLARYVGEMTAPTALPSTLDDRQLVTQVRAGSEEAATAFCRRLRPRVRATIARLIGLRDGEHEDLEQLSLIALVESLGRYRAECSLESWASAVTSRVVFKHVRRRKLERKHFDFAENAEEGSEPSSAERIVMARDLVSRVRSLLGRMDPDRAWAFLLHDVADFDLREVAEMTEVTVAAAQKRLIRGRAEIQQRVSNDRELAEAFAARDARA